MLSLAMATVSEDTAHVRCFGVERGSEAFRSEALAEITLKGLTSKD